MFIYLFFHNIIYYFYLSRNKIHVLYYLIYFQCRYARKFGLGFNFVCSHRKLRYAEACILFVTTFGSSIFHHGVLGVQAGESELTFVRDAFLFCPSGRTWIQIFGMVGGHPKKLAANSEILDKRGGGSNFSSFTRAPTSTPRPRRNPHRRHLP